MTFPREEDFNAGLLQDKIRSAGLKRHCSHAHQDCAVFQRDLFCFMMTFTDVKIQPSYKPGPTKSQRSIASTLMGRSASCLTESTPSWGVHITHRSVSQASEPHSHGHDKKKCIAVSIHLKNPCSFFRACFRLIIEKVNNAADLME